MNNMDLPRSSVIWFGAAFVLTLLPQLWLFLPMWVALMFVGCFVWRLRIYRMKMGFPSSIVKVAMILAVVGILYATQGNFLNTTGCSILLMAIYALKFVESKTVRDGYILSAVGLIGISTLYLFDRSIGMFIYSVLIFALIVSGMLSLQQVGYGRVNHKAQVFTALQLMALSLPLMIVLFLVFPRFPSLLPGRGQMTEVAKTGVSNSMTPGSIAKLASSDQHMFWAEFEGAVPKVNELYWRSLTLDHFDGKTWRATHAADALPQAGYRLPKSSKGQHYSVMMAPTQQRYLATLDLTLMDEGQNTIVPLPDFSYQYAHPVEQKIQYGGTYYKEAQLQNGQNVAEIAASGYTQITNDNPYTAALADRLWLESQNPTQYVQKILQHFRQDYVYTLEPGRLTSENTLDEFMFDTKRGFCEHYAGATAWMLRRAGISSRVVIGYLGGDIKAAERRVAVRGQEAHAWVEYWDQNHWVRLDPTMAVAPNRLDHGIEALLMALTGETTVGQGDQSWLAALKAWQEDLDYRWTKFVLGYQNQTQRSLFSMLFNVKEMTTALLLKVTIAFILLIVFALVLWVMKPWRSFKRTVSDEYQRLLALSNARFRLDLPQGTSIDEFKQALMPYLSEDEQKSLEKMQQMLVNYFYAPHKGVQSTTLVKKAILAMQKIVKGNNGTRRNG
ncbi:transglutaminaseTgpA domain-containing protein [Wohlfahrtiimonas chitiniclastica]|uniref:transglutaminase family protein n=1 Tax=Wohlfahrtiimonas chitiniclastica TaxID=400946 RepID=UPI001FEEE716|nr:DUF3488 and transglutaminase-like domain-containing protein [Wohlfahrtiimonas chitiniclastica]